MDPDAEVTREIAASPEAVFAVITDIDRLAELSPENFANDWHEGFSSAEVGAVWTGQNRNGDKEWSTQSKVTELVPNESFMFDCLSRDFVFAKWGYRIEETDAGCRVTEGFQDLRPEAAMERSKTISGVEDRIAHNKTGMAQTLERLAGVVEAG